MSQYILLILLDTAGVRVDEIARLARRDLRERGGAGQVTAYGKGVKTRVVLLPGSVYLETPAASRVQNLPACGVDSTGQPVVKPQLQVYSGRGCSGGVRSGSSRSGGRTAKHATSSDNHRHRLCRCSW